jgi:arginase family enzyme
VNNFEPPTHEDYLKVLIEKGVLKKENVIIVGLRNWHKEEYAFLKQNRIKFYSMKEISAEGVREVSEAVMSVAKNFDGLYVSMDIDAVDPSSAPGTGYMEPGGLTSRDMLYFLNRLKLLRNLKMLDLVEINPLKDVNEMTVSLGAKLVAESC